MAGAMLYLYEQGYRNFLFFVNSSNIFFTTDLEKCEWYAYNDCYGTSEEKYLVKYIESIYNNLSQKGYTAFGIIARERKILTTELSRILQLTQEDRLRSYIDKLLKDELIKSKGEKKGTYYFVNPLIIKNSKANIKTTLKTIEPHALRALILEDLRLHPNSLAKEILDRLTGVDIKELRKELYSMANNELSTYGASKNRTYSIKE